MPPVNIQERKKNGFGDRVCSVPGCGRLYYGKGFCNMHWQRVKKLGWDPVTMTPPERKPYPKRVKSPKVVCQIDGCESLAGPIVKLCKLHNDRARNRPHMLHAPKRGTRPKKDKSGYVWWWDDEKKKYQCEHRIVMEQIIGRTLRPEETVHHINGKRDDNRPENLELWSSSHPRGQRVADKVAWAKEILDLYGSYDFVDGKNPGQPGRGCD